jgi:predicted nucleic acid-binding protein
MADGLMFDTSFLIDFQRERRREECEGRAHMLLRTRSRTVLLLSATALGEFAEGFGSRDNPILQAVARFFRIMPVDDETAYHYGYVTRRLRASGKLIGTNDLWIAASALQHERPLVTANTAEFSRIDGLEVVAY